MRIFYRFSISSSGGMLRFGPCCLFEWRFLSYFALDARSLESFGHGNEHNLPEEIGYSRSSCLCYVSSRSFVHVIDPVSPFLVPSLSSKEILNMHWPSLKKCWALVSDIIFEGLGSIEWLFSTWSFPRSRQSTLLSRIDSKFVLYQTRIQRRRQIEWSEIFLSFEKIRQFKNQKSTSKGLSRRTRSLRSTLPAEWITSKHRSFSFWIQENNEWICLLQLSPRREAKLFCRYRHNNHPYLMLRPVKEEQVLDKPAVYLFHDVVTDKDINEIKALALPRVCSWEGEKFEDRSLRKVRSKETVHRWMIEFSLL